MLSLKTTSSLEKDILVSGSRLLHESVNRFLDAVYKVHSGSKTQKWKSLFLGENSHVEEIALKMGSSVQFFYLVLNYVPFILKIVLLSIYTVSKNYKSTHRSTWSFAPEILQYAFSETGMSFGMLPQSYIILLDLCWVCIFVDILLIG